MEPLTSVDPFLINKVPDALLPSIGKRLTARSYCNLLSGNKEAYWKFSTLRKCVTYRAQSLLEHTNFLGIKLTERKRRFDVDIMDKIERFPAFKWRIQNIDFTSDLTPDFLEQFGNFAKQEKITVYSFTTPDKFNSGACSIPEIKKFLENLRSRHIVASDKTVIRSSGFPPVSFPDNVTRAYLQQTDYSNKELMDLKVPDFMIDFHNADEMGVSAFLRSWQKGEREIVDGKIFKFRGDADACLHGVQASLLYERRYHRQSFLGGITVNNVPVSIKRNKIYILMRAGNLKVFLTVVFERDSIRVVLTSDPVAIFESILPVNLHRTVYE